MYLQVVFFCSSSRVCLIFCRHYLHHNRGHFIRAGFNIFHMSINLAFSINFFADTCVPKYTRTLTKFSVTWMQQRKTSWYKNYTRTVAAPGLGIWGGHLRGNTHFWGGGKIEFHEIPPPSLPKFLTPWIFFHTFFSEIFSRTFLIFFQTFKNCPGLPKFFTDLPKIFPRPTKNVIFLATFHKFLQFCLSNSDVSTTFGNFSQTSPLCRCGSYTHGS